MQRLTAFQPRLSTDPEANRVLLGALGSALAFIPDKDLFAHSLQPKYFADTDAEGSGGLPDNVLFLLNHLCPMLAPDKSGGCVTKLANGITLRIRVGQ